jgi:hypothetical protein
MIVKTQLTSPVADKAQKGVMELLLGNHPLDCPVCDKGGECPLQNQAMSNGRPDARLDGYKRTFEKPIASLHQYYLIVNAVFYVHDAHVSQNRLHQIHLLLSMSAARFSRSVYTRTIHLNLTSLEILFRSAQ